MTAKLYQILESTDLGSEVVSACTLQIHAHVLNTSKYIDQPNFNLIHQSDLELLFDEYDCRFFQGEVRQALGTTPLRFSLSKRMTSAGGKTSRFTNRLSGEQWFEISASTAILFECFEDDHRPIIASGIVCRDRLDALQRIMEHELIHLIELLLWEKSSCSQSRFHSISRRFFGHTQNRHQFITPREKAIVKSGIRPGMTVRFEYEGVVHTGRVNRINKRATVLVEDRRGMRYSDGKHYSKFYIPVEMLEAVGPANGE
ncbi:hypothetical protein [Planctomicrobium piriforme]|uniref:SprT-like family protein n=1 Tax=Planctomicrobium piriforme TaxID=1576369 RepID=A0A1I3M5Z9_9PLAN|nr:hypothetical protein [Planctomicrobium piriforme]SFI92260.1 hypothetical protein SAMN05421753_113165 [Planctomicrobium piriforme]